MFSSFASFFLDLLFPPVCLRCERESSWLCSRCERFLPSSFHREGNTWSLLPFHEPWVAAALHRLKYSGASALGKIFGKQLAARWPMPAATQTIVTAIPLHARRERERGFNQAETIAQAFAQELGIPYARLLSRHHHTRSQATLGYEDRQKNIRNAFALRVPPQTLDKKTKLVFPFKTVILIDDVMTTGATLREARRVLSKSGSVTIYSVTVAFAPKQG